MSFFKEDKFYRKHYDEFVVLLGTGMCVSEFCGLTKSDLDFENHIIRVDYQLVREQGGKTMSRERERSVRSFYPHDG